MYYSSNTVSSGQKNFSLTSSFDSEIFTFLWSLLIEERVSAQISKMVQSVLFPCFFMNVNSHLSKQKLKLAEIFPMGFEQLLHYSFNHY